MSAVKYRLAAVTSHPVQYQSPLFDRIAADPRIDLTVFYGHDGSIAGELDQDFGVRVRWDRPLAQRHRSIFLRRHSRRPGALARLAADCRIIARLGRGRFDAVFIHSYATRLSLLGYGGAVSGRTPVMLRTESERFCRRPAGLELAKQMLLRPLFMLTAGFLVIGRSNRDFYNAYGVPASRQFFAPYSVDNAYFTGERRRLEPRRPELRRAHGWDDRTVVIGFSGKLISRKRVCDLVDAAAELQRERLPIALLIVGDGPLRGELEARARAAGVAQTVFTGFRNQSELAPLYVCLDAFVLPSAYDTWGLVLNEAMLFGLPVVASRMVGAALDLVEEGQNGYVYDAGDVAALAAALRRLAESADLRRRFGRRSEQIVQGYSYDTCIESIVCCLQQITAGHPETHADARHEHRA